MAFVFLATVCYLVLIPSSQGSPAPCPPHLGLGGPGSSFSLSLDSVSPSGYFFHILLVAFSASPPPGASPTLLTACFPLLGWPWPSPWQDLTGPPFSRCLAVSSPLLSLPRTSGPPLSVFCLALSLHQPPTPVSFLSPHSGAGSLT